MMENICINHIDCILPKTNSNIFSHPPKCPPTQMSTHNSTTSLHHITMTVFNLSTDQNIACRLTPHTINYIEIESKLMHQFEDEPNCLYGFLMLDA